MKMEHRAIIESAERHGCRPSQLAHQLLVHDLIETCRFELHNLKAPYHKLNEGQQQEVIDRLTEKVEEAVELASGSSPRATSCRSRWTSGRSRWRPRP